MRGNLISIKMKLAHKIDNLRKPARKREFSTKWIFAESNVKRRLMIAHSGFPIASRHRDLVKVRRQSGKIVRCRIHSIAPNDCFYPTRREAHASCRQPKQSRATFSK